MKVTFREVKNEAVRTLRRVRQQHTQALLPEEELKIKIFLDNLLATQNTLISAQCEDYWDEGHVSGRLRLSDNQKTLLARNDVTKKVRKMVDYLLRLRFNERQKSSLMKALDDEIRSCITELMRSKKKRREERRAAQALTQSSIDIPPFEDVDMTRDVEVPREVEATSDVEVTSADSTPDPKTPYRNASGRQRRRSARMH